MVIPPKYAASKVVEIIKKNISRFLSRKFALLRKVYWDRKAFRVKVFCIDCRYQRRGDPQIRRIVS